MKFIQRNKIRGNKQLLVIIILLSIVVTIISESLSRVHHKNTKNKAMHSSKIRKTIITNNKKLHKKATKTKKLTKRLKKSKKTSLKHKKQRRSSPQSDDPNKASETTKCINSFALAPISLKIKPQSTKLPNIMVKYEKIEGDVEVFNNIVSITDTNARQNNKVIYTDEKNRPFTYFFERVLAVPGASNDFTLVIVHTLESPQNISIFPYVTLNIVFHVVEKESEKGGNDITDLLNGFTTEGKAVIDKISTAAGDKYYSYIGTSAFKDCVQNAIWIQIDRNVTLPSNKMKSIVESLKEKSKGEEAKPGENLNYVLKSGKYEKHNWRALWYFDKTENNSLEEAAKI